MEVVKISKLLFRFFFFKMDLIEYRRKENFWKNNQKLQLEKEEYDKLINFIPSFMTYVETFTKTFTDLIERSEVLIQLSMTLHQIQN